jgi:protein maelstrom
VSNINTKEYIIATVFGLFPAQIINVYLGSTLRSMEEVLSNKSTAATGFIVFFQVSDNYTVHKYASGIVRSHICFSLLLLLTIDIYVKERLKHKWNILCQFTKHWIFPKW